MAKKLFYKIGEACKKVDVQPYVLRYWETEFDLLSPDKSKSGQRVYTEDDLAIIRRIKELLYDEGYTTAGAKKKLQAELKEGGGKLPASSGKKAASEKSKTSKNESSKKASDEDAAAEDAPPEGADEGADEGAEPDDPEESDVPEESEGSEEADESEDSDGSEDSEETEDDGEGEAAGNEADERVEQLETGIRKALKQARKILQRLDESP